MFRNPATDALIVLFIVLIIFGPKRLPTLGKELGRGIREFKDSITTSSKDAEGEEERARLAASPAITEPPAVSPGPAGASHPADAKTDSATTPAAPRPSAETEARP